MPSETRTVDCEILVVGSGPGGSVTACLLAEAGRDVVLVEEGAHAPLDAVPPYSLDESDAKYRNGGITPALGRTTINYVEARCVGGGSEINAALYDRPPAQRLEAWRDGYRIADFGPRELEPFFAAGERDVPVACSPDGVGPVSSRLRDGAERLGWRAREMPRFWAYRRQDDGTWTGTRQSMTETLIPRAVRAGCRLLPNTRVVRLHVANGIAQHATARQEAAAARPATSVRIRFQTVFVCGGAIQTPVLLRRSRIRWNVGDSLRMHPMVRAAAQFESPVYEAARGVPVHQVDDFKPALTLGCSNSSLPYLALWIGGEAQARRQALARWRNMAIFYALTAGTGVGTVRSLPLLGEAFVRYPLTPADLRNLGQGLERLGRSLFTAGAVEIFPPIPGAPPIRHPRELEPFREGLPAGRTNVTAIHLFSSCPMGEDTGRCAVDSWGRLHGHANVYVNDASILPDTPGVGPQAVIMAIARRNVMHFLG